MRKALIVWGGWEGHEPERCAGIFREWLEEDGFSVALANTTEAFADPSLSELSLVVPIYTMSKIAKEEAANLVAAVAGGVGLAGHHGGMADAFRECVEYQFMVGGQWVAHPGNIIDYRVDVTRPGRPGHAGDRRASPTAPSSTTCMSIPRTRCWRRPLSAASTPTGSTAW